ERTRGDGGNSERAELLDLDDRHAGCIGELPVEVCRTSNADLNRALRIQHSVEYGQAKGTSVMKFRAVEGAHRVAVRVDVHQADRALAPKRLENRVAHRMSSAHRQRPHTPVGEAAVESFDILDRLLQTEAAAKGYVADIRRLDASLRHAPLRGVVGPNALDVAHGARTEAGARAIRHAKIGWHADHGDIELRDAGRSRQAEERRDAGVGWAAPPVGRRKIGGSGLQDRIVHRIDAGVAVAVPQRFELLLVHLCICATGCPSALVRQIRTAIHSSPPAVDLPNLYDKRTPNTRGSFL